MNLRSGFRGALRRMQETRVPALLRQSLAGMMTRNSNTNISAATPRRRTAVQITGDPRRPLNSWPVDGATIRMRGDWNGQPDSPRYVQSTGRVGPDANASLNDDELIYIRLNPRTHTPFGLGRLEVAFETVNAFLGAHRFAARLASNSVVQYALWLQDLTPEHHERLIRWWQDERSEERRVGKEGRVGGWPR